MKWNQGVQWPSEFILIQIDDFKSDFDRHYLNASWNGSFISVEMNNASLFFSRFIIFLGTETLVVVEVAEIC